MNILITSGGTKVDIDPVRYIGNMSSGTMGRNIALSAMAKGHHVTFLTSKNGKTPFSVDLNLYNLGLKKFNEGLEELKQNHTRHRHKYQELTYSTYDEYAKELNFLLESQNYDAIILCAAVSDYTVRYKEEKMRSQDDMLLPLFPTPKLIPEVMKLKGNAKVIGFKLLHNVSLSTMIETCRSYLDKYRLDMMVGNDLWCLRNNGYYNVHVFKSDLFKPEYVVSDFSDRIIESIELL